MTKTESTYAKFEAFEEQLAHCYFVFHERFIANPPLARFWAEAAMDERTIEHIDDLLDTAKDIANDPNVTVDEAFYASLPMDLSSKFCEREI